MSRSRNIALAALAVCAACRPAWGNAPVTWSDPGGNGHTYQLVKGFGITWDEADQKAWAMTYQGARGHLATLASHEEQQFLLDRVQSGSWVTFYGGVQDLAAADYKEPDGGWRWANGEPWAYTNWARGEPNNYYNGPGFDQEDRLAYFNYTPETRGWYDVPRNWRYGLGNYVVEYEPVPEPGTLALIALAAPGWIALRRRRNG